MIYFYLFVYVKRLAYICINKVKQPTMDTFNFNNVNEELEAFEAMAEKEACRIYNVDYKEEARQYIIDYWIFNS